MQLPSTTLVRTRAAVGATVLAATCLLAALQAWVVPATALRFQPMMRASLPTTADALNAPVVRLSALATIARWDRVSVNESRRRAASTFLWPATLAFLG